MSEYASFQEIIGNNPHMLTMTIFLSFKSYKYFNDKLLQLSCEQQSQQQTLFSEPTNIYPKRAILFLSPSFCSPKTSSRDRNSSVFKISYNMDRPGLDKKEEDVDPAASSQQIRFGAR